MRTLEQQAVLRRHASHDRLRRNAQELKPVANTNDSADIVIVGGGSAGAVLAARLSEDSSRTVLLLEAGPAYALDEIPAGLLDAGHVADADHDWGYTARANDEQRD